MPESGGRPVVHKMTGEVVKYWHERATQVARRLNEHGCAASATLAQGELQDGTPLLRIGFETDTFTKIVMAELAADRLDEMRSEAEKLFLASLGEPDEDAN